MKIRALLPPEAIIVRADVQTKEAAIDLLAELHDQVGHLSDKEAYERDVWKREGECVTAIGMGMAVTFVMAVASLVAYLVNTFLLIPLEIEYLQTIAFILVIAVLVQIVEMAIKKMSPGLYQALGVYLPLITTNCAVLGVAILMIQKEFNLLQSVTYSVATALGFALALVLFAGIRERLEFEDVPKAFRGVPIALITAGILAMAFMGFSGLV